MAEFKVGDRVRINCDCSDAGANGNRVFKITGLDVDLDFEIEDASCGCDYFSTHELVIATEQTNNGETSMANVDFEEKLRQQELSEDNKALIERGLMSGNLQLTASGKEAFNRYQFNQNKAEFVKAVVAFDPPKPAEKA